MITSMARLCTLTWTSPMMCERNIDLYMFDTRYDLSCLIWWSNNAKILIDCLKFDINVTAHVIGAHCRSLLRSNRVAVYPGSSHDSIRICSKYIRNRDLSDKSNWNFNANQSDETLAEGNSRVKNRVAHERVARLRTFTKESTEKPKRCDAVNVHARSEQPSGGSNLARICAAHFLPSLAHRLLFFPRHTTSCATGVLFTLDVTADSTILSTFFSLLFFFFCLFSLFPQITSESTCNRIAYSPLHSIIHDS